MTPTAVLQTLTDLDRWIEANGWAGWDPYDLRGTPLFQWLEGRRGHKAGRMAAGAAWWLGERFPLAARRLLRVTPATNAKAMALLALSHGLLHRLTGEARHRQRRDVCLGWLLGHNHAAQWRARQGRGGAGEGVQWLGWGYPFHWRSLVPIPAETPLCVPTVLAGLALLERWEAEGRPADRDALARIAAFLQQGLNRFEDPEGRLCFSYSPMDPFRVLNANLYVAAFLTRYGIACGQPEALATARRARAFSLAEQRPDGAWSYWSRHNLPPQGILVDNYHTGIVLEWLARCQRLDPAGVAGEAEALRRGAAFWCDRLFTPEGAPRHRHDHTWPVDIHGSAQALVTANVLDLWHGERDPGGADPMPEALVAAVHRFAVTRLRDPAGYFYYRLERSGRVNRIPYLRWSQGWMLWGLANLLQRQRRRAGIGGSGTGG